MKKKLQVLYVTFFCVALTGVALSVYGVNRWVLSAFFIAVLLFTILALGQWMTYIRALILRSSRALNMPESYRPKWSWGNLEKLEQNHEDVELKIQMSASLVSNLMHPEKMQSVQILGPNDPIGKAIEAIKQEMQSIREADEKRAWVTQGVARFSEILRKKTDVAEYANTIVSNLVRYIGANQGGLFIEYQDEEDVRYLELAACYAYGKQRFLEKRIREGQGMMGQCMLDKDFVYITDVPGTYVKITSGLGEATPRNIVVAPLIANETFCGAIELASFDILQPHQVEFLREVSKGIAAEIAALKTAEHTRKLLEASNNLTDELQSREEELKQNLDDLAAIQKEMSVKQSELTGIVNGINNTIASAEFAPDGSFRDANEIFLRLMGYIKTDLHQKPFDVLMGDDPAVIMMWENLRLGKFFTGEFKMKNREGKELWLSGTFNPIVIEGDRPGKIMMFAQFTTQEKEKLNDLNTMVHALKSTLPVIEFNGDFVCKTANDKAMKIFGLSRMELRSKTVFDFIAPYYHAMWNKNRAGMLTKDFTSLVLPFSIGGQIVPYEVSVSFARSLDGAIAKVIVLLVKEVNDQVPVLAVVQ